MTAGTTIGFIGLGNMGRPMAANLLASGHRLFVHSRTSIKAAALVEAGATWCDDPGAVARDADAVITMVGGPDDVAGLYRDALFRAARDGTLLIDMTTSSPRLAAALHDEAVARRLRLLDAPVTGGVGGAAAGTLAIMVGGDEADYRAARPILERLGKRIVWCGPAGSGQRLKLTNQTMVACIVVGLAEGFGLAAAGGLDLARLAPTLGEGTAGGFLFKAYAEKMIAGDFAATFSIAHFVKDLRLAAAEADSLGVEAVALRAALGQFERLARERGDALGIQAIAALYK
ncbi:MAG: NAD(P)-dependent oxidoreductase [Bacteroidota bacterium]